jgi:hypothetical protein
MDLIVTSYWEDSKTTIPGNINAWILFVLLSFFSVTHLDYAVG